MKPPEKSLWKEWIGFMWVSYLVAGGSILFFRDKSSWFITTVVFLFSGFLYGNLFFAVHELVPRVRYRSFWLNVLVRSLIMIGVLLVGMSFVVPLAISLSAHLSIFSAEVWGKFFELLRHNLGVWICFGLVLSFVINALFGIGRKLGPGVLMRWLTGKYYNPREEERIFMFLDLKNSTTLAEKLGNIRFSELCQDFFRDLSWPVEATKGEVSHYIGDEAVLCWKPANGLKEVNCLRCFYYMQWAIEKRSDYYRKKYGIVPEFKAGVHMGLVVATEVGDLKSEIVYHGDVLNTTARITGLCSEMGSDLLISGDLWRRLELPSELTATSLGMKLLKGKEHEVEIVAVSAVGEAPKATPKEPEPVASIQKR